jgi:hypothetical protein
MRIKHFLRISLVAALVGCAAACVKPDSYVFEDTSAVRMKKNLEDIARVLTTPQHGWYLEYYLKESLTGATTGGYTMLLQFDGKHVTAWGDAAGSTESASSLYKLTTDDGPILSFDSFNPVIHYFSTPSGNGTNSIGQSGHYQGLGGDFEFLVLEATPERVLLKGKRGGVEMQMFPLDKEPSEVISKIIDTSRDMFISAYLADDKVLKADFDLIKRHVIFSAVTGEESVELLETAFLFTEDGIRLPKKTLGERIESALEDDEALKAKVSGILPTLQGAAYYNTRDFTWQIADSTLNVGGCKLKGKVPDGWLRYEELAGEYTLSFDNPAKTVDIVLTPNVYRESYKLTGLNPLITLNVEYNVAAGNLNLFGQTIGTEGNYTVWWSPWSRVGGGSLWFNTSYGMKTVLDQASYEADPAHFTLNWVTGPCSTGKPVDSFIIYMREGSTSKGAAPARWNIPGTTARLPYLHSITKK